MKKLIVIFCLAIGAARCADAPVVSVSERYILTLEIRQSHFTLDIWEHIKDSANSVKMEIPVDKQFYDSVKVGDELKNEFRTGSLIIRGSFGSWHIGITEKKSVKQ